jgi:hypothetical protein
MDLCPRAQQTVRYRNRGLKEKAGNGTAKNGIFTCLSDFQECSELATFIDFKERGVA